MYSAPEAEEGHTIRPEDIMGRCWVDLTGATRRPSGLDGETGIMAMGVLCCQLAAYQLSAFSENR